MSYNITSVDVIYLDAKMKAQDIFDLCEKGEGLPEINFIEEHREDALFALKKDYRESIELKNFSWCGEGSGRTFDYLVKTIAPKIKGRVDVVLVWEGGDQIDGLRIENGVVTHCDVGYTLIPRNPRKQL